MTEAQDRSDVSRAESLFARLLVEGAGSVDARLEGLCAAHPELAGELREMARQRHALASFERDLAAGIQDPPPPRLGDFELVRRLGAGGMGEVWEARDLRLRRTVALKLLRGGTQAGEIELSRFRREAEAAGRVNHRGVVAVLSAGEAEGRRFIVQELVAGGRSLREWIEERRALVELPPEHYREIAALFLELTAALAAAHAAGIIHRDLKPQNVLLGADGRPKVADFGLALLEGDASLSAPGDFIGTYLYASPEQASGGQAPADARSDVFSLGATLYECLALRRAFDGDSVQQIVRRICHEDPPDPRALRSRVPADLAVIALKALEKRPEARYPSMAAFGEDLARHLRDEPILARPPGALQRGLKWMRRHPTWSTAAVLSSCALVVVSASLFGVLRARADEARANLALGHANVELEGARDEALRAAVAARQESEAREEVIGFLLTLFEAADPEVEENPSARTLVARGLERIRGGHVRDGATRARLLRTLGGVHARLGLMPQAREILEEADALWRQGDDRGNEAMLATLDLAELLVQAGNLARAEELLAPLAVRAEAGELPESLRWRLLGRQGALRIAQGEFEEAQVLLARAEELCRRLHGPSSRHTLDLRMLIAEAAWNLGDTPRVEALLQSAVEEGREGLSWGDPAVLQAVNLLGLVQTQKGDLEAAEATFLSTIESLRTRLGAEHPSVQVIENNLARVWEAAQRHAEAEEFYRRIVEQRSRALGRRDPQTLLILNNLGTCLARQGRFEEAAEVHREVLQARGETLGVGHPLRLLSANNLAYALFLGGDPAAALTLQEEVVRHTPPGAPQLAGRQAMLADIRRALEARH